MYSPSHVGPSKWQVNTHGAQIAPIRLHRADYGAKHNCWIAAQRHFGPVGWRASGGPERKALLMGHYRSNVRDLEFNLFEVLHLEKALASGEFGDLDGESVREMLHEASRLAEGPLAESFAEADRHPPT